MSSLPEQMKKIEKTFNDVELGKMFNKLTDDITASKIALGELQQKITDINTENKGGMFGGRTLWNVLTNSDYEDKATFTKQAKELEKKVKDLETLKKKIQDQAIENAKAREDEYKKSKDADKVLKTDPKAGKKENAQQAIDKLVVSLTSETLNGWDKTISEINEKVTKWTQTIDDAEKLLGKQAVARARSLVTDAKNALMVNAEQAYQANKDTFNYDFADEYSKAIQAIATKYSTFKKSLKEGEGGEAQTWVNRATAQADFNQKLKESNRVFSERENRINAMENEADKERELAQLAQDKINKEIELRNQYNQTNDKVIEVLTSQKELQKAVSNQAIANRERDNSLELLSYRETRNAKEAYQRESYAKELQLAINAGYTKEQAEFIALEKSKSTWDTYVDDISYSYSNMMDGLQEISKNAFSGMEDAFVSYMKTGKWSSKEFVDAIISDLMRMTVQMTITANLAKALGMGSKAIGDWWNSSAPTDAEFAAADASFTPKAKGGAYVGGVEKFAKGGTFSNSIVSKPTLFKFAKGTGMMGEAGAEAIMPLTRDSSGKLGVSASGAGGGVQNVKVEVINQSGTQVQANDVKISQSEQNGMIISIIVDDIRRGGAVAQAIRS
jgi:lambda family phage tail tape measure protein